MLSVKDVNLYYGAAQALRGVSMTAEVGKVTCVLGRNGVGKTSLLRAITGHHPISAGDILIDDASIAKIPTYDRARRGIAYVPQGREIFPLLTVKENLETGFAGLAKKDRFVPDDVFDLFPVLKDMLKRRGGDLSGGQQQQLAIGRALVTRPRLLVLDEPTEGIQPSIIKDIGRAIEYLRDGRPEAPSAEDGRRGHMSVFKLPEDQTNQDTNKIIGNAIEELKNRGDMAILLVEQYFDFAHELADEIVVMDRGAVIASGAKSELDADDVRRHLTV
ncbi:MAG: ABC transporter ATP-binding protein [Rhodospirillaceae bacterium]